MNDPKVPKKERSKARDIKESTIKKLFSLAHNECSFPDCTQIIAREDRNDFTVNICHIEAAEPGGERYNSNSNDEERRSYENLILLCNIHHIETNDEVKYTVKALKEMKSNHHAIMRKKLSSAGILTKYPSALAKVINQISSSNLIDNLDSTGTGSGFNIEDKITHNNIIRYKPMIREYGAYQGKLNTLYVEIEKQDSFKKEQLLHNIKGLYLKAKGKVLNGQDTIENIQARADDLIEEVEKGLWDSIEKSNNLIGDMPYEVINISLSVILVDAFMRCKILEEPPINDNQ